MFVYISLPWSTIQKICYVHEALKLNTSVNYLNYVDELRKYQQINKVLNNFNGK